MDTGDVCWSLGINISLVNTCLTYVYLTPWDRKYKRGEVIKLSNILP